MLIDLLESSKAIDLCPMGNIASKHHVLSHQMYTRVSLSFQYICDIWLNPAFSAKEIY